ncbi:G-D-S-L family lipolytic protein [Polaribacter sp. WD7]|uniref:G-D-S-L family lipolytic protein n=1 Tax=Polaribacter sp. WD7 TaxID=2269061 RepID=UPI000DF427A4|nr:G-D-S-L family lipolytic protein [Polaribacter sp. WD7]RCS26110.1 G-D-S-L family lipolytic protein [Polaribacter sp. WD7]
MKNYTYIALCCLAFGFSSCDVNNDLEAIQNTAPVVELDVRDLNFSSYVSLGASFTAGFTDGALFVASQENSFPNILASKFRLANGGDFTQPLMADNIGGFVLNGAAAQPPRLFFNGAGPARLNALPTTNLLARAEGNTFNNLGVPGLKSFHIVAPGYGNIQGVATGAANPYFARIASSPNATILEDALAQNPTFFSLSEIGGNDVLSFATSGGIGVDQRDNPDPRTYGSNDITSPIVFDASVDAMVGALTANGNTRGVIATVPDIQLLPFFTTVPHNPLDPSNASFRSQIALLNQVYGAVNQVFVAVGQTDRVITFSREIANPVVIKDESLVDLSATISGALGASPDFATFVQGFGLPAEAVPLVASLFGNFYGQARAATENDLLVLPSSAVIGTVNTSNFEFLVSQNFPPQLAGQFSAEGVTLPLADQWVLTPEEQASIKVATDAFNEKINTVANTNANLALVDLNQILIEASSGIVFDNFTLNTNLVTGGLISLDGIHLTARGYALMANKILESIDFKFGSNFTTATGGLAKAADFQTNYSPLLR